MRLRAELSTDVLVMGAGLAGIMSAISAAEAGADVCIVSSRKICSGSSFYPGTWGLGLIGPESREDEEDLVKTILKVGEGMADPELVRTLVANISGRISGLKEMGVVLKEAENKGEKEFIPCFDHKGRDWHGIVKESAQVVFKKRLTDLGVKTLPFTEIIDWVKEEGKITGAVAVSEEKGVMFLSCKALIAASGGMGGLFEYRLNTSDVTGMGQYLALKAGAVLTNLEFMQMMPGFIKPAYKTIYNEKVFCYSNFSDRVTGESIFKDRSGKELERRMEIRSSHGPFTSRLDSAPVDIRLFNSFLKDKTGVELTYQERIKKKQPEFVRTYFQWLLKEKHMTIDDPVMIGIFAHASNGGIRINSLGETGVAGLFACGEITGGMHGADRLGGLSTANGLVFGAIAGENAALWAKEQRRQALEETDSSQTIYEGASDLLKQVRRINFQCAMVVRWEKELLKGLNALEEIQNAMGSGRPWQKKDRKQDLLRSCELKAALTLSQCLLEAALARRESRGSHYRADYPKPCSEFSRPLDIKWKKIFS